MGNGFSHLIPCLNPNPTGPHKDHHHHNHHNEVAVDHHHQQLNQLQQVDETLGHSFRYVRSSARFLSPTSSDRFLSPNSQSFRFLDDRSRQFKAISGASVSANTSTPRTVLHLDNDVSVNDNGGGGGGNCTDLVYGSGSIVNGFDCTSSFFALPLQPLPRGESTSGFFLSGPIDAAGSLSGPLDSNSLEMGRVPFSAPLGGGGGPGYKKKRKKVGFSGIKRSLHRSFSEKKRPWVVPVGRKEGGGESGGGGGGGSGAGAGVVVRENDGYGCDGNVQWALGKAGEDRVHVVVSEEHGCLFVGIYDGFNGPDAPEFLMGHLYRAVFNELKGLFWGTEEEGNGGNRSSEFQQQEDEEVRVEVPASRGENEIVSRGESEIVSECVEEKGGCVKRVTFQSEQKEGRRKLWEFLAENDAEDGLDLSGPDRFAFSVDDAVSVSNTGSAQSAVTRRSLLLSKLKQGLIRSKEGHGRSFFRWRFGVVDDKDKVDTVNRLEEENYSCRNSRQRKLGPVDHELVLRALSQALEKTEQAYLDLTEKVIDQYPELALMGSCLLVVLMRDDDVYVMNVGDSRALVAQFESQEGCSNTGLKVVDGGPNGEGIVEECTTSGEKTNTVVDEVPLRQMNLAALQLSTDHCTSIQQEVLRIKSEHPNDNRCIVNDRVKGRLKVTRAFGAGFLKQPKFNESLLEMFRNEFIGDAPYISWMPSLRHHKLGPRDQFLVLSSDGLYQYLTNREVVSYVDNFMEKFPDGDPAQHLIEELLNRAAKKAGMDFHDLLDIPQGDRRKYHDDVTVMVISLEGRIWKSSGKYP